MADAAFEWLSKNSPKSVVTRRALWEGLRREYPELTASTPTRKTPRATLMRDIRLDKKQRFVADSHGVRLSERA
jgi:hypothetical protein